MVLSALPYPFRPFFPCLPPQPSPAKLVFLCRNIAFLLKYLLISVVFCDFLGALAQKSQKTTGFSSLPQPPPTLANPWPNLYQGWASGLGKWGSPKMVVLRACEKAGAKRFRELGFAGAPFTEIADYEVAKKLKTFKKREKAVRN